MLLLEEQCFFRYVFNGIIFDFLVGEVRVVQAAVEALSFDSCIKH